MDLVQTLSLMVKILSVLAIVQSIEFIILSPILSSRGVWRWESLEPELAGRNLFLQTLFRLTLKDSNFLILNIIRIVISLSLLVTPSAWGVFGLWVLHLLTLLRWRGAFNGGSDYMNLLILTCMSIILFAQENPKVIMACLLYITFQLCFSYFKAGFIKLKNRFWRNGMALKEFLSSPIYETNILLHSLSRSKYFLIFSSWLVILFEITFPISLMNTKFALIYIALGTSFHVLNVYLFGLNRFLLAWLSAYPALYFCAQWASEFLDSM